MYAKIQKWGNSHAIRLPISVLEAVSLHENDRVEINAEKDCITIRRANKKHKKLEERLSGYKENHHCDEWDTGKPHGKEVW
jgi:Growth regulator